MEKKRRILPFALSGKHRSNRGVEIAKINIDPRTRIKNRWFSIHATLYRIVDFPNWTWRYIFACHVYNGYTHRRAQPTTGVPGFFPYKICKLGHKSQINWRRTYNGRFSPRPQRGKPKVRSERTTNRVSYTVVGTICFCRENVYY